MQKGGRHSSTRRSDHDEIIASRANPAITIFHNPACGTSRTVLAAIREAGHEPKVVDYLKAGWRRDELADLLRRMGL
ncbi:MAG: hypothetical protein ABI306_02930, partial [Caulobacteraceae bacterium]